MSGSGHVSVKWIAMGGFLHVVIFIFQVRLKAIELSEHGWLFYMIHWKVFKMLVLSVVVALIFDVEI